jgi:hypothetical protein
LEFGYCKCCTIPYVYVRSLFFIIVDCIKCLFILIVDCVSLVFIFVSIVIGGFFFFFFFFVVVVGWLVNCHIKRTKKGKGELPKQYQTATLTRSVKSARGLQEFNLLQLHQNEDKVQGDRVVAKQHNNLVLNQP